MAESQSLRYSSERSSLVSVLGSMLSWRKFLCITGRRLVAGTSGVGASLRRIVLLDQPDLHFRCRLILSVLAEQLKNVPTLVLAAFAAKHADSETHQGTEELVEGIKLPSALQILEPSLTSVKKSVGSLSIMPSSVAGLGAIARSTHEPGAGCDAQVSKAMSDFRSSTTLALSLISSSTLDALSGVDARLRGVLLPSSLRFLRPRSRTPRRRSPFLVVGLRGFALMGSSKAEIASSPTSM
ncbi:hypothetical protein KCU61_g200, partial [Aureobasidium melanogenum]